MPDKLKPLRDLYSGKPKKQTEKANRKSKPKKQTEKANKTVVGDFFDMAIKAFSERPVQGAMTGAEVLLGTQDWAEGKKKKLKKTASF